jgi:hypothetical protein
VVRADVGNDAFMAPCHAGKRTAAHDSRPPHFFHTQEAFRALFAVCFELCILFPKAFTTMSSSGLGR